MGWMSPWLSNSEVTMDLFQEADYRYVMDWTCDDQRIWLTRPRDICAYIENLPPGIVPGS
jgi:hypothetical protein